MKAEMKTIVAIIVALAAVFGGVYALDYVAADDEPEPVASQGKMDYQRQKERERRIRQAEKKVKTLESKIAELEQKLADIEDQLSTATSENLDIYYTHSQISRELEEVMASWEQACEELEKAKK